MPESRLNKWKLSTKVGGKVEQIVCEALNSLGNDFVLNNITDVKEVDLTDGQMTVEVKTAFTPYPRGKKNLTPAGLTSENHLTLDKANIKKYDGIVLIVFAVVYPEVSGLYVIPAGKVKQILLDEPWREYTRSNRSFKDKSVKVGISLEECQRIDVDQKYITRIEAIAETYQR